MTTPMIGDTVHFVNSHGGCSAAIVLAITRQTDMDSLVLLVHGFDADYRSRKVLEDSRGLTGDATKGTWHLKHETERPRGTSMESHG